MSVRDHQENGPPVGPPEVGGRAPRTTRATPTNPIIFTSTLDSADRDIVSQHRGRRAASRRLPVQESRRSDPWWYDPPAAGYEDAVNHLLGQGLIPAPNREGLRAMWKRGGNSRASAELIAQRWGVVA